MLEQWKEFSKSFSSHEKAVDFAKVNHGRLTDNCTVLFTATYSYSKATYNVTRDKYRVCIHLRPIGREDHITYGVFSDTSRGAYVAARDVIEKGVL